MKNLSICIVDTDPDYLKAFACALALDHAGYDLDIRGVCDADCTKGCDVCLRFDALDTAQPCACAFVPVCGKYAGVSAIISEAAIFALDHTDSKPEAISRMAGALAEGTLICAFSWAGGVGTSCAAVGIGRELARYRGETVLYASLEDAEDTALSPVELHAMRAEETLYRYLRLSVEGAAQDAYTRLFCVAAGRDAYGLYRFAPDDGRGGFAAFAPAELYAFLCRLTSALGLTRVVLDFGTRLHFFAGFVALLEPGYAFCVEVRSEEDDAFHAPGETRRRPIFGDERDEAVIPAVFPVCAEDVRRQGDLVDVGLSNAFGLAVKAVCDRITGELR